MRRRRLKSAMAVTTASRLVFALVKRMASDSSCSGISIVVFMKRSSNSSNLRDFEIPSGAVLEYSRTDRRRLQAPCAISPTCRRACREPVFILWTSASSLRISAASASSTNCASLNRERAGAASRRDALSGNGQGRRRVAPRRVDRRPPVRTIRLTADASSRSRPTQDGHLHRLRGQERSSLRAVPRPPLHRVTSGDAQPCGQSLALM